MTVIELVTKDGGLLINPDSISHVKLNSKTVGIVFTADGHGEWWLFTTKEEAVLVYRALSHAMLKWNTSSTSQDTVLIDVSKGK
jgi:hypothetical protein